MPDAPLRRSQAQRDETRPSADALIRRAVAKLDKVALGLAFGALLGLVVFLATVVLLVKGGSVVGPNLALLGQYFIGYTVTPAGSLVGLGYGFAAGFVGGWLTAFLYNLAMTIYLLLVKFSVNMTAVPDVIDPDHR